MKKLLVSLTAALALCSFTNPSHAANFYWNTNSAVTWDNITANVGTAVGGPYSTIYGNTTGDTLTFTNNTSSFVVPIGGAGVTVNKFTNNGTAGTLTIGTASIVSNVTFGGTAPTVHANQKITFNAPVKGAITLTKTGPGQLQFNNNAQTISKIVVNAGVFTTANTNKFGTINNATDGMALNGGGWGIDTGSQFPDTRIGITLGVNGGSIGASAATIGAVIGGKITGPGGITIGGSVMNNSPNTSYNVAGTNMFLNTANDYAGSTTITVGTLSLGASGVIPDTSDVIVNGGVFNVNGFNETADTVTLTSGTISGAGTLTASSFTLTAGTSSSILAGVGATASKTAAGTLILSGASTYDGGFTFSSGTISMAGNNTFGTGMLSLNGGTIQSSAAGTARSATNAVTLGGNVTFGSVAGLTFSGPVTLTGNRILTVNNTNTISGSIGDSGGVNSITKAGAGTLVVTGSANTFSGAITNSAGIIQVNTTSRLGNEQGALVLNGGTLQTSASRTASTAPIGNPLILTNDSTINTISTSATVDLNFSNNIVSGPAGTNLTFSAGASGGFFPRFSGNGFSFAPNIIVDNGAGTAITTLSFFNTTGDQTFSGVISGNGKIARRASGGNTILTAQNTYSGGTTNSFGSFGLGVSSSFPTSGPLGTNSIIQAGGGLFASGGARTMENDFIYSGGLTVNGANDLTLSGAMGLGSTNRTITVTGVTNTISGVISSSVAAASTALTKAGSGVLVIPAANTYAGDTAVTDGRLKVTNPSGNATGSGSVNVTATGILGGDGTVAAASFSSGGKVAPGSSLGTLTVGNTIFGAAGVYETEMSDADTNLTVGVGKDFLNIQGILTVTATSGSPFVIDLSSMGGTAANFDNTQTYSWVIASATGGISGYTPGSIVVSNANFLNAVGAGGFGIAVVGNDVVLNFAIPPSISVQPVGSTNAIGASASFSVSASGTAPLGYQWKKNGSNIGSATESSFSIPVTAATDAGLYTVLVYNLAGAKLSDPAILGILPQINTNPLSSTNNPGDSATFTVVADGQTPLSYQWRKNGSNLTGKTTTALTINPVAGIDSGSYDVVVSNAVGTATSSAANLYVTPQILLQPVGIETNSGTAILTVQVSGTPSFNLLWRKDGSNLADIGGKIIGAVTNVSAVSNEVSLTISNLVSADSGAYTVVITNDYGSITSSVATIIVQDPTILTDPTNLTVNAGQTAVFSAVALSSTTPAYQWYQGATPVANDARISGADTASLTITLVQQSDAGPYTLVVTNTGGSATSAVATLTVIDPPVITVQPSNQDVGVGTNASFSISYTGTSPTLHWKRNGSNLSDGSSISGATTGSLTITGATHADDGIYTVVLTNAAGDTVSSNAVLTTYDAPVVTVQPISQTRAAGTNVVFSITATGTLPQFQWKVVAGGTTNSLVNGGDVSGATSANLTLNNLIAGNDGDYYVDVSNVAGSTSSDPVTLTVIAGVVITAQPQSLTVTNGDNASFTVAATGDGVLGYQWKKNGSNIGGETASALNLTSVTLSDAASYTVLVTNAANSVLSDVAVLTVNQIPTISVQPQSQAAIQTGVSVTFSVTAVGNPLNYQWSFNGNVISGATASSYTIASAQSTNVGYYSVEVSNNQGSVTSDNANLTIGAFFADKLDSDTRANWQTNSSGVNRITWAYDYSAISVPQAPGSTNTKALKFEANISGGAISGLSASPIGKSFTGDYQLRFNVWLNYLGPLLAGGGGSTEFGAWGIGTTGDRVPLNGGTANGMWMIADGDGNSGLGATTYPDYGIFTNATLVATNTGIYAAGTAGNARYALTPFYTAKFPSQFAPVGQSNSFNSQTGAMNAGAFGFSWHEVIVKKVGNVITFSADTFKLASITNATLAGSNFFIGYLDGFTSVSPAASNILECGLFANVKVEPVGAEAGTGVTISSQPSDLTTNAGKTATFTVTAAAVGTLRYQWQKEGIDIIGATNETLTISNLLAANAGTYRALVFNDLGYTNSTDATLTVIDPAINTQPQSIMTNTLSSVTFTLGAGGTGLFYQWNKDGGNISGATTSSYNIPSTATNDAGGYQAVVTGTYGSVTSSVATLTVNLSAQSINFAALGNKSYGDADFGVSATASSGNPVAFTSLTPGVITVSGTNITIVGTGPATIRASAGSDANYSAALNIDRSFTVNTAMLTVTANNTNRVYGASNPAFTTSFSGFVNGENLGTSDVTGSPSLNTTADASSPVGSHTITAAIGSLAAANYGFEFVNGSLSVTAAALTVSVENTNRFYGATNPVFTGSLVGIQNSDNIAATYSTTADTNSPVGTYPIIISLADPDTKFSNYIVTTNDGILTVTNAPLTVTSDNTNRIYGAENPTFTGSLAGLQNGDNITATYSTTADTNSPVGSYDITQALSDPDNKLGNYTVTTNNGSLTIASSALTFTSDSTNRTYGAANPMFTGSITGLQNGDNITATYSITADTNSPVGGYIITQTISDLGNKIGNYTAVTNDGTLTVTVADLTVTADDKTRATGQANPSFTGVITGIQNNDNITATYSTTADNLSPAGTYAIVPTLIDPDSKLVNYNVTTNQGTLAVIVTLKFLSATISSNQIQMLLDGQPGASYSIQASTNLVDWLGVTNFTITNTPFEFLDDLTVPQRFYRATEQ